MTLLVTSTGASGCGRLGFDTANSDNGLLGDDTGVSDAGGVLPTMNLVHKTDAPDWTPLTGPDLGLPYAVLTWVPSGPTFEFKLDAIGLDPGDTYVLLQYIDPWPGYPAVDIAPTATVAADGTLSIPWSSYELDRDLDATNGKVWLVPSSMVDTAADTMTTWDVAAILFEYDFIIYDDTDIP